MIAACVLLRSGDARTPGGAIAAVRRARGSQAVQTTRQEEFVHRYHAQAETLHRNLDQAPTCAQACLAMTSSTVSALR